MNTTHICPDCLQPLSTETYQWKHKPATRTHSCKTEECPLNGTTLDTGEWRTVDLNVYRKMNAAKAGAK